MSHYKSMKRHYHSRLLKNHLFETQRKIIRGTLFLIAITLIIIFIFGDHGLLQLYKLKTEKKEVQKQISLFRKNKEILTSEKTRLENDLQYIEKLAREKYRMAKPGEKVFKVMNKKN